MNSKVTIETSMEKENDVALAAKSVGRSVRKKKKKERNPSWNTFNSFKINKSLTEAGFGTDGVAPRHTERQQMNLLMKKIKEGKTNPIDAHIVTTSNMMDLFESSTITTTSAVDVSDAESVL